MTAPSTDQLVCLALGAALLLAGVAAWAGWWRRWADDVLFRPYPIAIGLPLGVVLLAYGVSSLVPGPSAFVGVAGLALTLGGFGVAAVDPRWFGPRWYRAKDREGDPDLSVAANAMLAASLPLPPGRGSEALARSQRGTPDVRRAVHLRATDDRDGGDGGTGGTGGALLIYPTEIVFAADRAYDALHAVALVRARPVLGMTVSLSGRGLRPDLIVGPGPQPWRLRCARPRRLRDELRRRAEHVDRGPMS